MTAPNQLSTFELVEAITAERRLPKSADRGDRLRALYLELVARCPPAPRPKARNPMEAARELADVLHFEVPISHRRRWGTAVTTAKRAAMGALTPFHAELLRPQRAFNLAIVGALGEVVGGGTPSLEPLEALRDPSPQSPRSHRGGLRGAAIEATKRGYLRASTLALQSVFARQAEWNARALALTRVTSERKLPPIEEANRLIAGLAAVCDPLGGPGSRSTRALAPLWREVFRRQERFNTEVMLALSNLLHGRPPVVAPSATDYRGWYEEREPAEIRRAAEGVRTLPHPPLISLVVPAWETPKEVLEACIESVRAQSYERWELCIVDDGSRGSQVRKALERYARKDARIRWTRLPRNGGIARATNAAIAMANGEWIAFLDHDDTLAPHALAEVALRLSREPALDWVYSDEDRVTLEGQRHTPFFKPDYSPELLRTVNYICHFVVVRAELVKSLGIREDFEGSQDYDFLLRLSARTERVGHIPKILYHWRSSSLSLSSDDRKLKAASNAGVRALQEHLAARGEAGTVTDTSPTNYRVRYPVRGRPLVSIIVPFKDRPDLLERLVRTLLEKTRYSHFELLLVSNNSVEPATFALLDSYTDARIQRLEWNHPFNYPAINNWAARQSRGELLLFLNNDMEVVHPGWLEELVGQAQRPEVGAVGPKLLFPDGSVQHAGVVVGICGYAAHPFWRFPDTGHWTPFGHADWNRNYLAVTSACVMLRREIFEKLEGYDERFRVCGSDVDLGIRIVQGLGLQVVYTTGTWLYHHESASRRNDAIPEDDHWESAVAYRRQLENGDPFYNPNLSLVATDCDLRRELSSAVELALEPLAQFAASHLES